MAINRLDNPVWHALTGPHRARAVGRGAARHYPREMAPFSAVAEPHAEAYADLALDLPPDTEARLFRPYEEELPRGWTQTDCFPMLQMIATAVLRPQSTPHRFWVRPTYQMMELVAAAKPGPFGPRTSLWAAMSA